MNNNNTYTVNQGKGATKAQSEHRRARSDKRVSALGNATKLRTPPLITQPNFDVVDYETGEIQSLGAISQSDAISQARAQRFNLQDVSRSILYNFEEKPRINQKGYEVHHRTCTCNRFRIATTAEIVKAENGKHFYRGLAQCADAKTCPVCAAKISERKGNEMRVALNQGLAMGLYVNLVTFTSSHNASDSIYDLVPKQSDALQRLWRGAPMKRFKERYGIIGNIRSFEIKYGKNGWHPHFHILVFSKIPLPTDNEDDDYQWLFNRWLSCSSKAGLSRPNHYGMDIRNGDKAGEYITKYGSDDEILSTISGDKVTWDMADEMTKGHLKTAGKSLTPWQILAQYDETKEPKYKALFLEYARALKGKTLLKWSRGLRDFFELGHQKTDEEIIAEETSAADHLCHLSVEEWDYILKNKARSLVLDLVTNGGLQALATYLSQSTLHSAEEYLEIMKNRDGADIDTANVQSVSTNKNHHVKYSAIVPSEKLNFFDRYEEKQKLKENIPYLPELLDFAQDLHKKIGAT
jgi:hypothetical protein